MFCLSERDSHRKWSLKSLLQLAWTFDFPPFYLLVGRTVDCGALADRRRGEDTTATANHHLETPGTLSSVQSSAQCRPSCDQTRADFVFSTPTTPIASYSSPQHWPLLR